ncbi:MAG: CCA tRNA nucleotidyltransferase [Sulfurimonas sp.]|nr:CCA tRNA nucleotidyltransferase [Sulfurimonas sp.]MDD3059325.1 CCA tRNA nucleotidyltransferase [Sulfurimonas sp.]MDD5202119.1 CCA tRNA nucleotidyltransferase [Sulfurimonas sp.]
MIHYPNTLDIIFNRLKKLHIRPIIVGGYIRDSLLGKESKDIDIELYGATSLEHIEEVLKEFGKIITVGKSFGVCKLLYDDLDLDFSLPRTETKVSTGHRGFKISTFANLDFKTAALRRDFTLNAIGFDVENKIFLDPHNGREALEKKVLHYVDKKSFVEDPLRILRAVQFCSRFDFSMSKELFVLCGEMVSQNMLQELPKERIYEETKKLLLQSKKPSVGLLLLKNLGAFSYFKEFLSLDEEVWQKTLLAVDFMATQLTNDTRTNMVLMLGLLSLSFEKNAKISFLERLSNEKKLLPCVLKLQECDLQQAMSDTSLMRLACKTTLQHCVLLSLALYPQNAAMYLAIQKRAQKLKILYKEPKALLHGKDLIALGLKPSVEFSQILKNAYEAQIDGKFKTNKEAQLWLKRELFS